MLATNLAGFLEVLLPREPHPAGTDDRLAEEGGDPLCTYSFDRGGEIVGAIPRDAFGFFAEFSPALAVGIESTEFRASPVHAVIGVVASEHDLSGGLTQHLPVAPHHLERGVDGV